MAPGDLAEEVRRNFQRLRGCRIRGIRWDRYDDGGEFLWPGNENLEVSGGENMRFNQKELKSSKNCLMIPGFFPWILNFGE